MQAIIADLARRFPEGYVSFTRGGKRTSTPNIYPAKCGFTVSIGGIWHVYDHGGKLISAGHDHNWIGHSPLHPVSPPQKPLPGAES